MSDDRLIDIETKLAFQENTVEELNRVVIKQQEEIDALKSTVGYVLDKMELLVDTNMERAPADDRPPHY